MWPLLLLAAAVPAAFAQPGTITTFAGAFPIGDGGPALKAAIDRPGAMAMDAEGNLYVAETFRIRKVTPSGIISTIAGTGINGFSGDGGPATSARIATAGFSGLAIDEDGNLFIGDNTRVRKVARDGIISTVAGSGTYGFGGDGGPAIRAQIKFVSGLCVDRDGSLYIADGTDNRIRRVKPDGTIETIAGNGQAAFAGDGGPAVQASLNLPRDMVFDSAGNLLVIESDNDRIRSISRDGMIRTIAGGGRTLGDGGPATGALLDNPHTLSIDSAGNLYFSEWMRASVRKVSASGIISTVAGTGVRGTAGDGGPATKAELDVLRGVLADRRGNLYISEWSASCIRRVNASGIIERIAGASSTEGDSGTAAFARIMWPTGVFVAGGNLLVSESNNWKVRSVGGDGRIAWLAGRSFGLATDGAPARSADANQPMDVVADGAGTVYYSDLTNNFVYAASADGWVRAYAGRPIYGAGSYGGDGGPANRALLSHPTGLAMDSAGTLWLADQNNHRIRRVTSDGVITTVAGTGTAGFSGDGGPATAAAISGPEGVAVDSAGNLFIADTDNHRIRKVTASGIIVTYAGNGRNAYSGDNGPATAAGIPFPRRLAIDGAGNLYVSENSSRVRRISPNGTITTVAGNGTQGFGGDGGPATAAMLNTPQGLAVDANGNLYIADSANNRIRRVEGSIPLTASPAGLLFTFPLGGPADTQTVTLNSSDGESHWVNATANAPWLKVSQVGGGVAAKSPVTLTVTADPKSIAKGTYRALIQVANDVAPLSIPVTMTVSGTAQQLKLSQSGVAFSAVVGGAAPPSQSIRVLNSGTGTIDWTAVSSTLSGGSGWLRVSPASGRSDTAGVAPSLDVKAEPAGLPAGTYYGLVTATSRAADNSPQSALALLAVVPADQAPAPVLDPAGMVFTASPGGANPANQSAQLANITTAAVTFTGTASYPDRQTWFTLSPASGTVAAGAVQTIEIRPNITGIAAGTYRGTVAVRTQPGNLTRNLALVLVIAAGANRSSGKEPGNAADPACTANRVVPVFRSPGDGYTVKAGWPITVQVKAVDNCGNAVNRGGAVVSFNSGDPSIALTAVGDGTWTGTWAARQVQSKGTELAARVSAASPAIEGESKIVVGVSANPDQPLISAGGVLNAASFERGAPVAPGSYISIFGNKLAAGFQVAQALPLPTDLADTVALIAGLPLPLHFASDGQVNAIVPYGVADSTTQQLIVRRGRTYSLPEPVLVGANQPAIFATDGSGKGQGHVYVYTPEGPRLADAARPAKPGEALILYATGLGPVTEKVADGQAAPSGPLALTASPVKVTVQGKEAKVFFSGLAPGYVGLYQINVFVPEGIRADSAAQVIVTAGESASPPVTMAVEP